MVIQTLTGKDSFLGVAALEGSCRDIPTDSNSFVLSSQLPGRLFSLSDTYKQKISPYFLLHFSIGMGSYDHHTK